MVTEPSDYHRYEFKFSHKFAFRDGPELIPELMCVRYFQLFKLRRLPPASSS